MAPSPTVRWGVLVAAAALLVTGAVSLAFVGSSSRPAGAPRVSATTTTPATTAPTATTAPATTTPATTTPTATAAPATTIPSAPTASSLAATGIDADIALLAGDVMVIGLVIVGLEECTRLVGWAWGSGRPSRRDRYRPRHSVGR